MNMHLNQIHSHANPAQPQYYTIYRANHTEYPAIRTLKLLNLKLSYLGSHKRINH